MPHIVGGMVEDPEYPERWPYAGKPAPMMAYNLAAGATDALAELPVRYKNPVAAAKDGTVLLYNPTDGQVTRVAGGEARVLEGALPAFALAKPGELGGIVGDDRIPGLGALAPVSAGFVFVGPPAEGGASDTYLLRDGADAFEPYARRCSEARVFAPAACSYRGWLYVIGSSWVEPEGRLFRATAMEVPEYAGDLPCPADADKPDTPDKPDKPADTKRAAPAATSAAAGSLPRTADSHSAGLVALIAGVGFSLVEAARRLRARA